MHNKKLVCYSDIYICIVLYKKNIEDCETFQSIIKCKCKEKLTILIYDNSPDANLTQSKINQQYSNNFDIGYYPNFYNHGISGAYIHALNTAKNIQRKWLVFFDQDSTIPPNYFEVLLDAINNNMNIDLFCPKVTSDNILISPSIFVAGRPWLKERISNGIIDCKSHTIINSGIAIRLSKFEGLNGYSLALPLDYSDHYFFYKFKKSNKVFFVLDIEIQHQLSSLNEISFEDTFQRFRLYCNASKTFSSLVSKKSVLFWLLVRSFKLSYKFKNLSFARYALHTLGK